MQEVSSPLTKTGSGSEAEHAGGTDADSCRVPSQPLGCPLAPAHLCMSSQLQTELELLTGAQYATSGGDLCCAEACLVSQELEDTWVGLLSCAGLPGYAWNPDRGLSTAVCSAGGWQTGDPQQNSSARRSLVG